MPFDERALFTEKPETRAGRFQCPKCHRTSDYSIRWVRRSKKDRLPPGADEQDRAKFAKLRDYMLRLDDEVTCKVCGNRWPLQVLTSSEHGRVLGPLICPNGCGTDDQVATDPRI